MGNKVATVDLETEGNEVSTSFHRDTAVRCFREALDASGVDDKVLADECGMSRGYFSKRASGQQGSLFDLAYQLPARRASIRADFFSRLAEQENLDPVTQAAEQAVMAALRLIRVCQRGSSRMAKAGLRVNLKTEIAS